MASDPGKGKKRGRAQGSSDDEFSPTASPALTKRQKRQRSTVVKRGVEAQYRELDVTVKTENIRHATAGIGSERPSLTSGAVINTEEATALSKLMAAIEKVTINTFAPPTKAHQDDELRSFDYFFTQPARPGRSWVIDLQKVTSNQSRKTNAPSITRFVFGAKDGKLRRHFGSILAHLMTDKHAEESNQHLVNMLNSWPVDDLSAISTANVSPGFNMTAVQTMLLRAARVRVDPTMTTYVKRGIFRRDARLTSGYTVQCIVTLFDSKTLEPWNRTFSAPVHTVHEIDDIAIPPTVRLVDQMSNRGVDLSPMSVNPETGVATYDSRVPADLGESEPYRAQLLMAERLCDAFAVAAAGKIMSKSEYTAWATAWVKRHTTSGNARSTASIYNGSQICKLACDLDYGVIRISPTKAVNDDVDGTLPEIRISTIDRARVMPCIDAMIEKFEIGGNVKDAWLAACVMANFEEQDIANGMDNSRHCGCPPNLQGRLRHYCGGCGNLHKCASLAIGPFGIRVCAICRASELKSKSLPERVFLLLTISMMRGEAPAMGISGDSTVQQRDIDAVTGHIHNMFTSDTGLLDNNGNITMKWPDRYEQEYREHTAHRRYNPEQLSTDAIFPYNRSVDGRVRAHTVDNIAPVAYGANCLKHIHFPGMLMAVSDNLKTIERLKSTLADQPEELQAKIAAQHKTAAQILKTMRQARMKFGYKKEARFKLRKTDKQLKLDLEQFRAANLRRADRSLSKKWMQFQYASGMRDYDLTAEDIASIKLFCADAMQEFGVDIQTSRDGCFYPGVPGTMPSGWSWKMASLWICTRFWRLREWCNGKHKTKDDPARLFKFLILSICITRCAPGEETGKLYSRERKMELKARYTDMLELPFVLDMFDACCIAFTHAEHQQAMFTGLEPGATSLTQWHEAENNLLVETQASNYMKKNFAKRDYKMLLRMVRRFDIDLTIYDPKLKLGDISPDDDVDDDDLDIAAAFTTHVDPMASHGSATQQGAWFPDVGATSSEQQTDLQPPSGRRSTHREAQADPMELDVVSHETVMPYSASMVDRYQHLNEQMAVRYFHLLGDSAVIAAFQGMQVALETGDQSKFDRHEAELIKSTGPMDDAVPSAGPSTKRPSQQAKTKDDLTHEMNVRNSALRMEALDLFGKIDNALCLKYELGMSSAMQQGDLEAFEEHAQALRLLIDSIKPDQTPAMLAKPYSYGPPVNTARLYPYGTSHASTISHDNLTIEHMTQKLRSASQFYQLLADPGHLRKDKVEYHIDEAQKAIQSGNSQKFSEEFASIRGLFEEAEIPFWPM